MGRKVIRDQGWLAAAADCCPLPLPAFTPLQLDLSQDGWCELLPVMYSEPLLSNITVCSKRLYLAFSESPTFFHPRPLLISVALCVLIARINPPESGAIDHELHHLRPIN